MTSIEAYVEALLVNGYLADLVYELDEALMLAMKPLYSGAWQSSKHQRFHDLLRFVFDSDDCVDVGAIVVSF